MVTAMAIILYLSRLFLEENIQFADEFCEIRLKEMVHKFANFNSIARR